MLALSFLSARVAESVGAYTASSFLAKSWQHLLSARLPSRGGKGMAMLQSFGPAQCCNEGLKRGLRCTCILNLLHCPFCVMLGLP